MHHSGTALVDPQVVFSKIHLVPGMRVADLGCGRTGQFVFSSSKIVGDKGIVYAVDILKDVLEDIRNRTKIEAHTNIQTIWSDIEMVGKAPIPANTVNVTFLTNVLFLVKDKVSALTEAARLTMPNGYVVVVDWIKQLGPLGPSADLLLKPEDIIETAKKAGLVFDDQFSLNENHYCLLFKK